MFSPGARFFSATLEGLTPMTRLSSCPGGPIVWLTPWKQAGEVMALVAGCRRRRSACPGDVVGHDHRRIVLKAVAELKHGVAVGRLVRQSGSSVARRAKTTESHEVVAVEIRRAWTDLASPRRAVVGSRWMLGI
jgi:hypothetical protein